MGLRCSKSDYNRNHETEKSLPENDFVFENSLLSFFAIAMVDECTMSLHNLSTSCNKHQITQLKQVIPSRNPYMFQNKMEIKKMHSSSAKKKLNMTIQGQIVCWIGAPIGFCIFLDSKDKSLNIFQSLGVFHSQNFRGFRVPKPVALTLSATSDYTA